MNGRVKQFVGNISYVVSSNLTSTLISILIVLIVPKVLGVSEYGYWQMYLLYASYTGFLQLGWCDGVYLKYGGREYNQLNKALMKSQFIYVTLMYILLGILVIGSCILFFPEVVYPNILVYTGISGVITTARGLFYYILQATNRFKEYAKMTFLDRICFGILVALFMLLGNQNFEMIVLADLLGKAASLIGVLWICSDILKVKAASIKISLKEGLENIRIGIKLMFAGVASMLIIGIVRLGIEAKWDIQTFSKVSLTLSISNLLMVFINAVGLVMFPILRKTEQKNLPDIYKILRTAIMIPLLGMLIFYYPVKEILSMWLPKYADSLHYMALLFPLCIFESKMSLLINTYLKALRKEKQILIVNVIAVCSSAILSYIVINIMESITLAVVLIVVLFGFRCLIAEYCISTILKISVVKDFLLEVILSAVFMVVSWNIDNASSMIIYAFAYIFYLFIKRNSIKEIYKKVKALK